MSLKRDKATRGCATRRLIVQMVQCALNGSYGRADHPEVPVRSDSRGRRDHLPDRGCGIGAPAPAPGGRGGVAARRRPRRRCRGDPRGFVLALRIRARPRRVIDLGDAPDRIAAVQAWSAPPDVVSLNLVEDGSDRARQRAAGLRHRHRGRHLHARRRRHAARRTLGRSGVPRPRRGHLRARRRRRRRAGRADRRPRGRPGPAAALARRRACQLGGRRRRSRRRQGRARRPGRHDHRSRRRPGARDAAQVAQVARS